MAVPINPTQLTPPRVPVIDDRTGAISREWYRFFLSLLTATQATQDQMDLTTDTESLLASYEAVFNDFAQAVSQQPDANTAVADLDAKLDSLSYSFSLLPRPELGTMAPLQQADIPWVTFNNSPTPVPTAVGSVYWDGGTTLGVQMTANVIGRVGESEYVYAKASAAITKGKLCYHTGAVGSSGVITVAPTPLALADPNQIIGVAAETIALNGFGLIQISGDLRGFNTTGASVGEVWADGDPLYYNPSFVGSMTKTKPSAPNQKTYIGEVTNAGPGGSGSMNVRIVPGSILGGTDSNVQFSTLADKDLIQYYSAGGYWRNVAYSNVTVGYADNLTGGAANRILYQTATNATGFIAAPTISSTVLTWNGSAFTWTTPATGTVTSIDVSGGSTGLTFSGGPITTSGTITMAGTLGVTYGGTGATTAADARTNLGATTVGANFFTLTNPSAITFPRINADNTVSALDASTFRTAIGAGTGNGTVTSVAALTLGTTGTDLSSTVATGTTTPVITLNVPTASAANRGALSSTDWSTFNDKQAALVSGTNIKTVGGVSLLGSGDVGAIGVTYGGTGTATAFTAGSVVFAGTSGVYSQSNANFFWDNTNARLGLGTTTPAQRAHIRQDLNGTIGLLIHNRNGTGSPVAAIQFISGAFDLSDSRYAQITSDGGASNFLKFWTGNAAAPTQKMQIDNNGNVCIGTTSVSALLTVNGSMALNAPVSVTAATYSVATTDNWIIANRAGTVTLTLPTASSYTGRILTVKNVQAQTVVSASSNVVPIGSTTAGTAILAATAGKFAKLVSDGTNWVIMEAN